MSHHGDLGEFLTAAASTDEPMTSQPTKRSPHFSILTPSHHQFSPNVYSSLNFSVNLSFPRTLVFSQEISYFLDEFIHHISS